MSAAEWCCDWRGKRYYDDLDARVAKIIDPSLKEGISEKRMK